MQRTIFYQSIIPGGYILSPPKPLNGEKTIYLKIYEFMFEIILSPWLFSYKNLHRKTYSFHMQI